MVDEKTSRVPVHPVAVAEQVHWLQVASTELPTA
jgi:hypothetical protein